MTISLSRARQVCSKPEYALVLASSHKKLQELTPSRIKPKIDRARKLRDKFRSLAQSQRREARGKQDPRRSKPASDNQRTELKAAIFQETLERFEKGLKEAEARKMTKKKNSKKKKTTKKGTTARKTSTAANKKTKSRSKTKGSSATTSNANKTKASSRKSTSKTAAKKKTTKSAARKKIIRKKVKKSSVKSKAAARVSASTTGAATIKPKGGSQVPLGSSDSSSIESRKTRRKRSSKTARSGALENRFAHTAQQKIQGHVSAQTRRNQAKRDTK